MPTEKVHIFSNKGPMVEGESGLFLFTRGMFRELVTSRELTWRLFLRDFRAKYRQSALGLLWALLMPVITVGIFALMNRSGVISIPDSGVPYPVYSIIGLSIWSLFTAALSLSAVSFVNAGSMVVKINFPKISLVLSAFGQSLVDFFIRVVLIAVVCVYYGYTPKLEGILLGVVALLPLLILTLGLGCFFALLGAIFRDLSNALNLAFMALMLLSPILYPIQEDTTLAKINLWNPLNYLVNVPRDLILANQTKDITSFLIVSALCFVAGYIFWRLFYLAQPKISERV